MKTNYVLTMEQQSFAAQNHDLVYAFLNRNCLPEDDYYDVVIFGYLRAVRKYWERAELREYAFSTIAWRAMKCEMSNHFQKEATRSQRARMVSLDVMTESPDMFSGLDIVFDADRIVEALEAADQWNMIRRRLTPEQTDALQLSADGYTSREISSEWKRPLRDIEELFAGALSSAYAACAV